MRIWDNLEQMQETTFWLFKRGFLLSALLMGAGSLAILSGNWPVADTCRDLSASVLLLTVVGTCYIEMRG